MTLGPQGFQFAQFSQEPAFETEIPNLLGEAVMKKPAAVLKRPAAKMRPEVEFEDEDGDEEVEEEEEGWTEGEAKEEAEEDANEEDEENEAEQEQQGEGKQQAAKEVSGRKATKASSVTQPPASREVDRKYKLEVYHKVASFGVRQCFQSKKQIFSIGGKQFTLKQKSAWATEALKKLHAGESEEAVSAWAKLQMNK
jgi:hypothetical protein